MSVSHQLPSLPYVPPSGARPPRAVNRFATWLDDRGERLFRRPQQSLPLRQAVALVSNLGVYSLVWAALCIGGAITLPDHRSMMWALFVALPLEFALTNGIVKSIFRRRRPIEPLAGPGVARLIRPKTSSFPSGHASAAAMSAVALLGAGWTGLVAVVLALVVAASRVFLRLHYASDVVGGICWGACLGLLVRTLVG
jgi:undecaprenyl-diphosphatase